MSVSNSPQKVRPKVGVVLSSGGLKPVSALGFFEFIKEENIDIDLWVGCSGGGIVTAMQNAGFDTQQIVGILTEALSQRVFSKIDYQTVFNIVGLPYTKFGLTKGLLKKNLALKWSHKVFGGLQLEDLPVKTVFQTTNIQNGNGVILEKGLLADAVYATSAMYPLFPPMYLEDQWLVDGVYSSPLPVLEAVNRNMDIIIVLAFYENLVPDPERFTEGFFNTTRAFSRALIQSQLSLAIDLHHYEIIVVNIPFDTPVSMSDPKQIPQLVEIGRKAIDRKKTEILNTIKNFHH